MVEKSVIINVEDGSRVRPDSRETTESPIINELIKITFLPEFQK